MYMWPYWFGWFMLSACCRFLVVFCGYRPIGVAGLQKHCRGEKRQGFFAAALDVTAAADRRSNSIDRSRPPAISSSALLPQSIPLFSFFAIFSARTRRTIALVTFRG